jgi:ABC-type molybdenum transport system ATPase subunit/photorepair protein PhrA
MAAGKACWPTFLADTGNVSGHRVTFRMEKVTVRYGRRIILENVNWEVRNGEKWALSGPNGSGKTLLLSRFRAFETAPFCLLLFSTLN